MEGLKKSLQNSQSLLTCRGNKSSNSAEILGSFFAAEAAGNLLLDLDHPYVPLALIVRKGDGEVFHECHDVLLMFKQSNPQINGRMLLLAASLSCGFWSRRKLR